MQKLNSVGQLVAFFSMKPSSSRYLINMGKIVQRLFEWPDFIILLQGYIYMSGGNVNIVGCRRPKDSEYSLTLSTE